MQDGEYDIKVYVNGINLNYYNYADLNIAGVETLDFMTVTGSMYDDLNN